MRCFIAMGLPQDVRNRLRVLIEHMKPLCSSVKWVGAENFHLTLKFLGNVQDETLPEMEKALTEAVSSHPVIRLQALGLGVFPNPNWPKVVWTGLAEPEDGGGKLLTLQKGIEEAVVPLGFNPDKRAFTPHLTIGRINARRGKNLQIERMVQEVQTRQMEDFGSFEAREIVLFKSDLKPSGAVHTALFKTPLG